MSDDVRLAALFHEQLEQLQLPDQATWTPLQRTRKAVRVGPELALGTIGLFLAAAVVVSAQLAVREDDGGVGADSRQLSLYPAASGDSSWFTLTVPAGWSVSRTDETIVARGSGRRAAQLASRSLEGFSARHPFPNHLDWARLPKDVVIIEVRDICGGLSCVTSPEESSFPLRWSEAKDLADITRAEAPVGFDAKALVFRYFAEGHVVVAYVGSEARVQDRAVVENVVGGIRPRVLPSSGVVQDGWLAVGPLSSLPVDEPVFARLPSPPTSGVDYYVIRHGPGALAHPMSYQTALGVFCSLGWDRSNGTFSCPGHTQRWDRFGRVVQGPANDLDQFLTLIKDGRVYIHFASTSGGPVRLPGE